MSRPDRLESIEPAALAHVTGGAASSASSAMMLAFAMAAMGRRRATPKIAPEAPVPAAPAQSPVKLEVNGKEEQLVAGKDGVLTFDNTKQAAAAPATQTA